MEDCAKQGQIRGLTGLRGLAATWVLVLHAWQFAGGKQYPFAAGDWVVDPTWLVSCGYFGVDLFFVLSGFLLSMPYHRAAAGQAPWPSLKRFWLHRVRRVIPAYWLQLLILVGVYAWLGNAAVLTPSNLVAHVALIQNLMPVPQPLLNPVYWSMPVEWDFYLVLPLIAVLLLRARLGLVVALALAWSLTYRLLAFLSWFDPESAGWISYPNIHQLQGRIDQFVYGMAAAWLLVRRLAWSRRMAGSMFYAGLVGVLAMVLVAGPKGDFLVNLDTPWLFFHHSLLAAAFALLVLGVAAGAGVGERLFSGRLMVWLGLVSYSLYLWHYPMLTALRGLRAYAWTGLSTPVGVVVIGLPAILLVSWLSYRFVERPFLARDAKPMA